MKPVYKNQQKQLFRIPLHIKIAVGVSLFVALLVTRFTVSLIVPAEANNLPQASASVQPEPRPQPQYLLQTPLAPITPSLEEQLTTVLNRWYESVADARIGIHIAAVDDSFVVERNAAEQFTAASLYKTLAAYSVLQRVDAQELSLTMRADGSYTVADCIERAITISDNPCGLALQRLANPYVFDEQLKTWGYSETTLSGTFPSTSARDQHALFADIYNGVRITTESREVLLSALRQQRILNRTPDYPDAIAYVKTGDWNDSVNVTTLVDDSPHTYTISILSDDWDANLWDKYAAITQLHKEVHDVIRAN